MGDILNHQDTIGRDDRDEEIEGSVGTICGGIRMEKHISIQSASLNLKTKEGMNRIKYRYLSEKAVIKADLQNTTAMVKKINQDQRRPM